jgi:hypothetical protein
MSGKARWQRHERRTSGTEGVEDWLAGFVRRDISGTTGRTISDITPHKIQNRSE